MSIHPLMRGIIVIQFFKGFVQQNFQDFHLYPFKPETYSWQLGLEQHAFLSQWEHFLAVVIIGPVKEMDEISEIPLGKAQPQTAMHDVDVPKFGVQKYS